MPNANYVKGRRKKYKIIKNLKFLNYNIAHRTAGSHSPIDVFGINKKTKKIVLIQAKPDNFPLSKIKKLNEEFAWLNDEFKVEFKVV